VRQLAQFLHELPENSEIKYIMCSVISHLVISMLYQGKINEESYLDYEYIIKEYIKMLASVNVEMQVFYANFLLKKSEIIQVLSEQFFSIKDELLKKDILKAIDAYFPKEKDDIIKTIWDRAFALYQNNDEILINAIQWYMLDKRTDLIGLKELLKLCRFFLMNNNTKSASFLYQYIVKYAESEEMKEMSKMKPAMQIYEEENKMEISETGKQNIKEIAEREILYKELKGIKLLIETIELNNSIKYEEQKSKEIMPDYYENQQKRCSVLKSNIRVLLFETERPIVNILSEEIKEFDHEKSLGAEYIQHDEELQKIATLFVGSLIKWDIDRAIIAEDYESVWEFLNEVMSRELTGYIMNDNEIKDILQIVGDVACWSPDIISSLIQKNPS